MILLSGMLIVEEVSASQFFAGHTCNTRHRFIHVGDLTFCADSYQGIEAGFYQTPGIL